MEDPASKIENYHELFTFLPMNCWVKIDSYDFTSEDSELIVNFLESTSILSNKKIQSARIYPVSLPILLIDHHLAWKAHYYSQIRVICNYGNETETIHLSAIHFLKTDHWVYCDTSISPLIRIIGTSENVSSEVTLPELYPSPNLLYGYYVRHMLNFSEFELKSDYNLGIQLLFSSQLWNPFFNSDLPFIEQGKNPVVFNDLICPPSSDDLYAYLPRNFSFSSTKHELNNNEKSIFIQQAKTIMENSGYENPNHFDWENADIQVGNTLEMSSNEGENYTYFSDISVEVQKKSKPNSKNRYMFSSLRSKSEWLFQNSDQISSYDGWYVKYPRYYRFSGIDYNESKYYLYLSVISSLLLNRYPVERSRDITLLFSLERWNFSSIHK